MLATLPDASVQCVVTSPPYFGLRAYGTDPQVWGGDPDHGHVWVERNEYHNPGDATAGPRQKTNIGAITGRGVIRDAHCPCGAWRGELGSEPTPSLFVEHLVSILDEVGRVMRPDGVLFCNLGDSYAGSGKGTPGPGALIKHTERQGFTGAGADARNGTAPVHKTGGTYGVRPKSLLLIPQRFAIAMQDAGWYVRSQIAWCKTSAMPESVRDRPTSAWEPIWMFTKQARYFWDQEAVRVEATSFGRQHTTGIQPPKVRGYADATGQRGHGGDLSINYERQTANLRNFWLLGPEPSREAHYASFVSEIPRRCILAATSEKGQCPACGAPWVRVVERERGTPGELRGYQAGVHGTTPSVTHGKGSPNAVAGANYMQMTARGGIRSETTGWQPGCQCNAGDPVPQLVLDPFLGSGTTALVADQLGRHAVGIELNPEYARMAERRITNDGPMFANVTVSV